MPAFFGTRIVRAAFLLAILGWGIGFYGPPVFLHAVIARTGWPLEWVSAAVTLHFISGVLVVANLPRLYRRLGLPVVTTGGAVLLAAGVTGWALAAAPWQLALAAMLSGVGWVTMGAAAINAIVTPWFRRKRPAALSTAYNGASIGGVILSPLWVLAIDRLGFTGAAIAICGTAVVLTGWLSVSVFAKTPESLGQHPDGDAAPLAETEPVQVVGVHLRLRRDARFLTLAAGMALGLFAQIGMVAHLFTVLAPRIGGQEAGLAMGLATAAAIGGRMVAVRILGLGISRRSLAAGSYAVQAAGVLLFLAAGESVALTLSAILLFGSGIGNATSLPPLIAQAEFSPATVQRVVPLIVAIGQASYAFAPAAYGLVRTSFFGDPGFFVAVALVQLLALLCFLIGRRAA